MPVMDGLSFLKALRADGRTPAPPVIVLTAAGERKLVTAAASLGARDYMLKSQFSLADLLERVRRRLGSDESTAAGTAAASGGVVESATPPMTTIDARATDAKVGGHPGPGSGVGAAGHTTQTGQRRMPAAAPPPPEDSAAAA